MKIDNSIKAEIFTELLPNIQLYRNKIVVIKYGGNAMLNSELKKMVMDDIVLLNTIGIKIILVHGGGPSINNVLDKMNIESKFYNGLRVTDDETINVVQMVLAGKINKDLVCDIGNVGGNAVGISGMDGNMLKCKPLNETYGYVGNIIETNMKLVNELVDKLWIPVVSSIGYDELGNCYNINADTVAAKIASQVGAEALILMTDVSGLLREKDNQQSLISSINLAELAELKNMGIISGGMIPKIDSIIYALREGVNKAFVIYGRIPHSIIMELLTDEGLGTMFRR